MKFEITMKLERSSDGAIIKSEKKWQHKVYLSCVILAGLFILLFIYYGKSGSSMWHQQYEKIHTYWIQEKGWKKDANVLASRLNNEVKVLKTHYCDIHNFKQLYSQLYLDISRYVSIVDNYKHLTIEYKL